MLVENVWTKYTISKLFNVRVIANQEHISLRIQNLVELVKVISFISVKLSHVRLAEKAHST